MAITWRQAAADWFALARSAARGLLADGVDIRLIQLILGHSDIKTTQRYLNITDEEMRKVLTEPTTVASERLWSVEK